MLRLRRLGFAVAVACGTFAVGERAHAAPGRHLHFNDRGTLVWYTSLDEAQAVARASGKLIFIDSGRRRCPNCQTFLEEVMPDAQVRTRVGAIAIGLAVDCDDSDARVDKILREGIPNPVMLPLCGFVTPELRWVTGWSGYMDLPRFSGHVSVAEQSHARIQSYRRRPAPAPPCAPAAPTPPRAPAPAPSVPPIGGADDCPGGVCRLPPRPPAPTPKVATPPLPSAPSAPKPVAPATPPLAKQPAATPPVTPVPTPPVPSPPVQTPGTPPVARSSATQPALPIPNLPRLAPPADPSAPVAIATPVAPIHRARAAAAEGRWGDVFRVADAAPTLSRTERTELDSLVRRGQDWVLASFDVVYRAGVERKYPVAKRMLVRMQDELTGTTCPSLIEAERGLGAIDRLSAIEQGSPDRVDAPELLRRDAYAQLRGSRWAGWFRSPATK
jgi:hypothetical protein